MIPANELRIGNWVYHTNTFCNPFMQVIPKDFVNELNNDGFYQFDPILLTPEILEKCGFVTDMNDTYYYEFEENFRLGYIEYLGEKNYFLDGYVYTLKAIRYLHELQNLYFSLTGNEINFTP